jgi:hypothetical protein
MTTNEELWQRCTELYVSLYQLEKDMAAAGFNDTELLLRKASIPLNQASVSMHKRVAMLAKLFLEGSA